MSCQLPRGEIAHKPWQGLLHSSICAFVWTLEIPAMEKSFQALLRTEMATKSAMITQNAKLWWSLGHAHLT